MRSHLRLIAVASLVGLLFSASPALASSDPNTPAPKTGDGAADAAPAGNAFTPLGPVRLVDSRIALGVPSALSSGVPVQFAVAGAKGVPPDATAVSGNLTVTGASGNGYVSLTVSRPAGTPGTSTLNFIRGDTRANGVIAALGPDGSLWATSMGANCALVFDVSGYFRPSGDSWYPLVPARLLDTRSGLGLSGSFKPGDSRSLQVTGFGGVPAGAAAITGNLTAVSNGAGFLAVTPDPAAKPGTSTLNFPSGDIRANNLIAPLSAAGSIALTFAGSGSVAVVLDVTGYFMPDSGGSLFVPLTPSRVLDSRISLGASGIFTKGHPRTLSLAGAGLAGRVLAIAGNLTVTGVSAAGYGYVLPAPGPIFTSNLNIPKGDTRANGFVSALGPGPSLTVGYESSGGGAQMVMDLSGYFVAPDDSFGTPVGAAFTNPPPGTDILTTASGETVTWTIDAGLLHSVALTQAIGIATGANCTNWGPGATITIASGVTDHIFSNYASGHCYRYSLVINGNPVGAVTSGLRRFPASASKVPVLMYHLVDPVVGSNLAGLVVDPAVFNAEMAALYANGWRTITAADLGRRLATHAYIPDKSFVITFDDGNVDDYTYAFPILQKYGFVASFYLITGRTGHPGNISWDQAATMARAGDEIANHTVWHKDVLYIHGSTLASEIGDAANSITTNLAARGLTVTVTTFAYPMGGFDAEAENYLRAHGYTAAFTEVSGAVRAGQNVEELPRVRVPRGYNAADLLAAMNRS